MVHWTCDIRGQGNFSWEQKIAERRTKTEKGTWASLTLDFFTS